MYVLFSLLCPILLHPSILSVISALPPVVCQVIAMYDYKAANKDEMSFQKGQLISVLNKDNPDWWKGEVAGVIGLLPTNYVKMTTECDPSQQCEYYESYLISSCFHIRFQSSLFIRQAWVKLIVLEITF